MPKRRLPECVSPAWLDVIDEVARRELGRQDRTGPALADEVKRLSEIYTRRTSLREGPRSPGALAARLRFFLPRDLAKARGPIDELLRAGALPTQDTWRVLDVGAGLGATTLGTLSALDADRADVVAIDDDRHALSLFAALVRGATERDLIPRTTVATHLANLEKSEVPDGPFDIALVGLVLNELPPARRLDLLVSLSSRLAADGVLVVIEPALRETTRELHVLRDALVARAAPPFVAAPCIRESTCPMLATERDWCHEDLPLSLPSALHPIAQAAGLRYEGLSYSYLTLRNRRGGLHASALARARIPSPSSTSPTSVREGGVALRVVSEALVSKGKREIFGCGVPGRIRLVRLDRAATPANAAFDDADRGDVLEVAPLIVDDRERAKIDAETSVTALATLAARA